MTGGDRPDPDAGRVALVTGGGRGIGGAIALMLADGGCDVAIGCLRDEQSALETAVAIQALGVHALCVQAAMADPESCEAMMTDVADRLGPVGTLVLYAGISSRGRFVADTDPGELERVLRTDVFGAHRLWALAIPGTRAMDLGDIVIISPVAASECWGGGAPCNMAKAAPEALARTLAKEEVGHRIHVNVVAPGMVAETEMGVRALSGSGLPDAAALDARSPWAGSADPKTWLTSSRISSRRPPPHVTGQRIEVDGGCDALALLMS
jgi:3-oxoacyl-[acyl-carrier protein] reductase